MGSYREPLELDRGSAFLYNEEDVDVPYPHQKTEMLRINGLRMKSSSLMLTVALTGRRFAPTVTTPNLIRRIPA